MPSKGILGTIANKNEAVQVIPIFNMSVVNGSNTTTNDITLDLDTATYDGVSRLSVDDDYTTYDVGTSLGMQGNTTLITVDFEVSAIDAIGTIWFVDDRNLPDQIE